MHRVYKEKEEKREHEETREREAWMGSLESQVWRGNRAFLAAPAPLVLVGPKEKRVNQDFQDCLAL